MRQIIYANGFIPESAISTEQSAASKQEDLEFDLALAACNLLVAKARTDGLVASNIFTDVDGETWIVTAKKVP